MNKPISVFIPTRYESRYSLLGAMARELAEAFAERGFSVCDEFPASGSEREPGLFLFFNMLPSYEAIPEAVRRPGSRVAALQILVDHPLALDAGLMDQCSRLPNFRLALPSIDGLHLLRLRWPGLSHGHVPHGIPRGSLIERDRLSEAAYAGREFDVVVAGSIHSREELAVLRRAVPTQAQPWIDEIVALMAAEPWMPFEQAMDLVMGSRGVITGAWGTMSAVWRVVTAELNREQRTRMVSGLQGLDVAVFGGSAWGEQCAGSIRYAGQCAYSELPRALARGRACLAWGPTQFEHTFSERLLLSMAAGCASVADDRYMIGRHFGFDGADASVRVFDARQPGACRAAFEAVLSDPAAMVALARQGRAAVEAGHLWSHRVDSIASLGLGAIAEAESRPPSLVRPASAERRSA